MVIMDNALRVGLVGAGSWAHRIHGPGLQTHPGTRAAAVWARRPDAAKELAAEHGIPVADSFAELLHSVDAVAFAVPPEVQAELAPQAAAAGKHLILEKPLAADPDGAVAVADAVHRTGVAALMMLTRRFAPETQEWLQQLHQAGGWRGATGRWLSGGLLSSDDAASSWRREQGALLDAGPHAVDLLDAALGVIQQVNYATCDHEDTWQVMFGHAGGATSALTLSLRTPVQPSVIDFAAHGEHGYLPLAGGRTAARECYAQLLDDLLEMITTGPGDHPCGVQRGLHLQRVLAAVRQAA